MHAFGSTPAKLTPFKNGRPVVYPNPSAAQVYLELAKAIAARTVEILTSMQPGL
jgi:hypothetical protein